MYTAKSVGKLVKDGALHVTVEYTDGKDVTTEVYFANSGSDPQWLENRVRNKLLALNTLVDFSESLELGPIAPPPITQTKYQLWLTDLSKFKQLQAAVDLGLITEADEDFVSQRKKVREEFDKSYLDSVRI